MRKLAGPIATLRTVTVSGELYVIPDGYGGYSCLGFDILIDRYNRLAAEVGNEPSFPPTLRGTIAGYDLYRSLQVRAEATGHRFSCELSPQLIGLEGRRVEVETVYGETRRFQVGRSTGWIPIHLEVHNRRSSGGPAAERTYKTVRVVE